MVDNYWFVELAQHLIMKSKAPGKTIFNSGINGCGFTGGTAFEGRHF